MNEDYDFDDVPPLIGAEIEQLDQHLTDHYQNLKLLGSIKGLCLCHNCTDAHPDQPHALRPNFIQRRQANKHHSITEYVKLTRHQFLSGRQLLKRFAAYVRSNVIAGPQAPQQHPLAQPIPPNNPLAHLPIGTQYHHLPQRIPPNNHPLVHLPIGLGQAPDHHLQELLEEEGEDEGIYINIVDAIEEEGNEVQGQVQDELPEHAPEARQPLYLRNGVRVGFYAERAEAYKRAPPSRDELQHTLPGRDGGQFTRSSAIAEEKLSDMAVMEAARTVVKLMLNKLANSTSEAAFSQNMEVWISCPQVSEELRDCLKKYCSTYPSAVRFMESMGATTRMVKYDLCSNVCCSHVYRKDTQDMESCPNPKCKAPRCRAQDGKPYRSMYYLPIQDWLIRLHSRKHLAPLLDWWKDDRRAQGVLQEGVQTDVYDSPVWQTFKQDGVMHKKREYNLICIQ